MQFADIAPLVTAVTGVCTLMLSLYIAVQAMRIHDKTDELVVHTNSLTDKLMAKTDTLARAEGIKEGAAQGAEQTAAMTKATAEAAAMIIQVAADQAAKVLAQAVMDAKKEA